MIVLIDTNGKNMSQRKYYSARTGKNPNGDKFDLPILLRLFRDLFVDFHVREYFQEAFGYFCDDVGEVRGVLGHDIEAQMFRLIRKQDLWPIKEKCLEYTEDDVFDVIEFLYDYISRPVDGFYHDWNNCGWHYDTFDKATGQEEFRSMVNEILKDYKTGFELSANGEVLTLAEQGLENLFAADLPIYDPENVESRVESAILKFRRYKSSLNDRRDAIRDLADVLEFLRPKVKAVLTAQDENDIFNVANNFGIRHHNDRQKTDYDKAIWYSWIFYFYLSTIHACMRMIKKAEGKD